MIKLLLTLNILFLFAFPQILSQDKIDFHSSSNTRLFADYLYCQKDYLRAYDEYEIFLHRVYNDTVDFRAGIALQNIASYKKALIHFNHIPLRSYYYPSAREEYARTLFLEKDFTSLRTAFAQTDSSRDYYPFIKRLNNISYFYNDSVLPDQSLFISAFPLNQKDYVKKFYKWKDDPPYKSPLLAGILSTVIPGLGKVYTEEYSDAFFAALLTGLFGYLSYTNFNADHQLRAWIFTGVTAFFYGGNIYGSAASAQIYNAKIRFNFEIELHDFLDAFHYLSGDYSFCK